MQVKARVLDPPSLSFAKCAPVPLRCLSIIADLTVSAESANGNGEALVQPRDGGWRLGREKFTAPGKVERWVVVVFDSDQLSGNGPRAQGFTLPQVQQAVTLFAEACEKFGIRFRSKQPAIHHAGDTVGVVFLRFLREVSRASKAHSLGPQMDVRGAFIKAASKGGYSPQLPPQLIVTFVSYTPHFRLSHASYVAD